MSQGPFNNNIQHNKAVLRRQRKGRGGQTRFQIYLTAVSLMGQLARLEPHLPRAYKFTLGRLLLDWSAQLVYRIDRMIMLRGDRRPALEDIAATVRTMEAMFMKLVDLHALPDVSPVTEADAALMFEDIEEQARALWKKNNEELSRTARKVGTRQESPATPTGGDGHHIQAGTCPGQGPPG